MRALSFALFAAEACAQLGLVELAKSKMCEMHDLGGRVSDCMCDFEAVDEATTGYFGPILQNLTARAFFRYFKIDLTRECKFFPDDAMCMRRECAIDVCSPAEIPSLWLEEDTRRSEWAANVQEDETPEFCQQFGGVDGGVDRASEADAWAESGGEEVWIVQDNEAPGNEYIDLLKNPEKYTGYDGEPAKRIWRAVYEENCFSPSTPKERLLVAWRVEEQCLERRVFYKLISGLQASISTHIAKTSRPWVTAEDVKRWVLGVAVETFFPSNRTALTDLESASNDILFVDRVGAHSERLHNLYFTYLFVLRAVTRASSELEHFDYTTGDDADDAMTSDLVRQLVRSQEKEEEYYCATAEAARAAFDETKLFSPPNDPRMSPLERALARESVEELRAEFLGRFRNISLIMDCVSCERCKLWGTLQVLGLGTALKILMLADDPVGLGSLQRNEVVALVNTLAQLAKSVDSVREWQRRDLRRAIAKMACLAFSAACLILAACAAAFRARKRSPAAATR